MKRKDSTVIFPYPFHLKMYAFKMGEERWGMKGTYYFSVLRKKNGAPCRLVDVPQSMQTHNTDRS